MQNAKAGTNEEINMKSADFNYSLASYRAKSVFLGIRVGVIYRKAIWTTSGICYKDMASLGRS